jgi:hypothetical protein
MHVLVLAASAYLEKEDAEWRIGLEVDMVTYIPLFEMTGIATLFFGCMSDSKTFWFRSNFHPALILDRILTLTSLTPTTISVISTPAFR